MNGGAPRPDDLKRLLIKRVTRRKWGGGVHYQLDLRAKGLNGTRTKLRDPDHPRWPDRGRGPKNLTEAHRWVDPYVDRLGVAWVTGEIPELPTVRECGDSHLKALRELKGDDSSTVRNRSSHFRNHIYPSVGDEALGALGAQQVQDLLDGMTRQSGGPAGTYLKQGVLSTLNVLWRKFCKGSPPWEGEIELTPGVDPNRMRRERAKLGLVEPAGSDYDWEDMNRLIVAAMKLDLEAQGRNPKLKRLNRMVDLVVALICFPFRIEEAAFTRQKFIDLELGVWTIAGTKSAASVGRLVPVQNAYLPWQERLIAKDRHPEDFVFAATSPKRMPSDSTLKGWVGDVLLEADLKMPGDLTHFFRAMYLSSAVGAGVPEGAVAVLAGHKLVKAPLISDHYLTGKAFIAGLPPIARNHVPELVSPEEAEERARRWIRDGKPPVW